MRKYLHYIIILALILFASGTVASAIGRDDFEVLDTTEFEEVCGLQDADFYSRGHSCVVRKSYLESDAGKSLLERIEKCMDAYRSGNPGASPGKPSVLLDVLRRNSLRETYWHRVNFVKGDRLILVMNSEINGGKRVTGPASIMKAILWCLSAAEYMTGIPILMHWFSMNMPARPKTGPESTSQV